MDVSARPYAHPLPSRPKSGPLFGPLAHTLMLRLLVPSGPNTHTQTLMCRHTQGPFSTGTLGRGCHGDNRPTPPLPDGEKLKSGIIPNVECVSVSVHSRPTSWHSRRRRLGSSETVGSVGPWNDTHSLHNSHFDASSLCNGCEGFARPLE